MNTSFIDRPMVLQPSHEFAARAQLVYLPPSNKEWSCPDIQGCIKLQLT